MNERAALSETASAAAGPPALQVESLSHSFGERKALDGVSFAIRPGVFTVLLAKLPFDAMLTRVTEAGLEAIELGTGGYPGSDHVDVDALLDDGAAADTFRAQIEDRGLIISALSCLWSP